MLHKALLTSSKAFRVSIGSQTNCSVTVNKQSATPGEVVTVTVSSNAGYGNVQVAVSPSASVSKINETTFTFIMPNSDATVSASASVLDFKITVYKYGNGSYDVKSIARYGEQVTLTVFPGGVNIACGVSAMTEITEQATNRYIFTMPAFDLAINVSFKEYHVAVTGGRTDRYFGYVAGQCGSLSRNPYWLYSGMQCTLKILGDRINGSTAAVGVANIALEPWDAFGDHVSVTTNKAGSKTLLRLHDNAPGEYVYGGYKDFEFGFMNTTGKVVYVNFTPPPAGYL